jgi:hypothetical protein
MFLLLQFEGYKTSHRILSNDMIESVHRFVHIVNPESRVTKILSYHRFIGFAIEE